MARREGPFPSRLPNDSALEALESRNDQLLSALGDKSDVLLDLSRSLRGVLDDDKRKLDALSSSMNKGSDLAAKSRAALGWINNDPTAFGVCKIATVVFLTLVIIKFLLKSGYRLIRRQ
jgi:hypothetical protein